MWEQEIVKEKTEQVTKLSVIVCTIPERILFLRSVIGNILKQNYLPYEVLVVTDAGASDLIRGRIPEHVYSLLNMKVIESEGFGLSKRDK